jgi:hypothetical protein
MAINDKCYECSLYAYDFPCYFLKGTFYALLNVEQSLLEY